MKRSSGPSRPKALTIFLKKRSPTASRSIASEGQQPTLNDQGVTVAKRVIAGRAAVQTMTMEELHRHAVTCRNGKQDWHHNSGKAIKSGRLRVSRKEDGSYEIEPAELARVFLLSAHGETDKESRQVRTTSPLYAARGG